MRRVFYVRSPVSHRDLEEIMAERGVDLNHATLNRWVEKYAGAIAKEAQLRKAPTLAHAFSGHYCAIPCQVRDETYVKV